MLGFLGPLGLPAWGQESLRLPLSRAAAELPEPSVTATCSICLLGSQML